MSETLMAYGASPRQLEEAALSPQLHLARVLAQYQGLYRVVTQGGEGLATLSGSLRHETRTLSSYPAVGDFVLVDRDSFDQGEAVIHQVLPRKSLFTRAAVGERDQAQVIAANIDLVFLCMALNRDYNLARLERYLSIAWDSGATPVVVLTKADLCDHLPAALLEVASIAPGVEVLAVSQMDAASLAPLTALLTPGITASLIGSSGVGKSTLVNLLAGAELLKTAATRGDDKGRHTTTGRELLRLPSGCLLIDTPGMRELGLHSADVGKSFSEIEALAEGCRFRDCTHNGEPGCAVQRAVEAGQLEERRLESYQKLRKEAKYEGLNSRQIEAEKLDAMFGGKGELKKVRDYIKNKNRQQGR